MSTPRRSAHRRKAAATAGVAAALVAVVAASGLTSAQAAGTTATAGVQAASPKQWPTMIPQGARWSVNGKRTEHDYFLTTPLQGSPRERATGSTRHEAIRVWQGQLREQGFRIPVNGIYDRTTAGAVQQFQRRYNTRVPSKHRLPTNGVIGYPTARALLAPTIHKLARRHGVPAALLCGHLMAETRLDPRAVGPDGTDYGIGQMSRRWNQGRYSLAQAFDDDTSIDYMAKRDKAALRKYGSYRIGVVSYWKPREADLWKRTGKPSPVALTYSDRVLRGCGGHEFGG